MPYAIHLRKSRADLEAEARGAGESLARHRTRLLAFAERMGFDITSEYREIISGDRLSDRPEMQRLLRDVAADAYDGVLTVEISRLTRGDLMDQGRIMNTFKYSNTRIITPEHTYDLSEEWDEDMIASDMMMARREYKYIKKRLQRGRLASAVEGLWQSPAPYGYQRVKVRPGKGWTLAPDQQQAPIVRMIFDLFTTRHMGLSAISDHLNALGLRTNRGNPFTPDSLTCILRNPTYVGMVRWNYRTSVTRMSPDGMLTTKRERCDDPILVPGRHPALIPPEQFEEARRIRSAHDLVRNHKHTAVKNPLAGLVRCAVCGRILIRKDNGNAKGSRCDLLKCPTRGCPTTSAALSLVEASVLDILSTWTVSDDQPPSAAAPDPTAERLAAAQAALDRLTAQLTRIYAAYEQGAYDVTEFVSRRSEKQDEIAETRASIESLRAASVLNDTEIIRSFIPKNHSALELYASCSIAERNRLLKSVISRIEYRKTTRCLRNRSPSDSLTLHIFPHFLN